VSPASNAHRLRRVDGRADGRTIIIHRWACIFTFRRLRRVFAWNFPVVKLYIVFDTSIAHFFALCIRGVDHLKRTHAR